MQILGRQVQALKYEGTPIMNVYVKKRPGDCQKEQQAGYECFDTCHGNFVTARFMQTQPISLAFARALRIFGLFPEVEKAKQTSPGSARASICLENILSTP